MAWHIQDHVIRGEIDNRVKGMVRGAIWLHGLQEPVRLELEGNAWPDLAGCFLTFKNSAKPIPFARQEGFSPLQRGTAGDLTASRKVRVPDVPIGEFIRARKPAGVGSRMKKAPEHMGNGLYLEWFNETNGRVLIEGVDWPLEISPPLWRLTPEEIDQQAALATEGMVNFMKRLTEKIEKHRRGQKDPDAEWDEHDYERLLRECDARGEKYQELLEKYGDADGAEEKIATEMGWTDEGKNEEEFDAEGLHLEEMSRAAEEALDQPPPEPDPDREGIDWIRAKDGELRHPLQHRSFESAIKFFHIAKEFGLDETRNGDLQDFIFEFQTTGVKLAGALSPIAQGEAVPDPPFTVAYLKRALGHLHQAQAGLEGVARQKLLPVGAVVEARRELFGIREGILQLMDQYRGRS
jgi:hypothetical protein